MVSSKRGENAKMVPPPRRLNLRSLSPHATAGRPRRLPHSLHVAYALYASATHNDTTQVKVPTTILFFLPLQCRG